MLNCMRIATTISNVFGQFPQPPRDNLPTDNVSNPHRRITIQKASSTGQKEGGKEETSTPDHSANLGVFRAGNAAIHEAYGGDPFAAWKCDPLQNKLISDQIGYDCNAREFYYVFYRRNAGVVVSHAWVGEGGR